IHSSTYPTHSPTPYSSTYFSFPPTPSLLLAHTPLHVGVQGGASKLKKDERLRVSQSPSYEAFCVRTEVL
ncbi:hypothetical protein Pcinc_032869, partial [Petrolisthes cinctipes]